MGINRACYNFSNTHSLMELLLTANIQKFAAHFRNSQKDMLGILKTHQDTSRLLNAS